MNEQKLNILVIGSGGREHTLAWKITQSPKTKAVFTAAGNPGTAMLGENFNIPFSDTKAIVKLARDKEINLVVIGPENALDAGLSDALNEAGIPVFGPGSEAAKIESSKAFSKDFMHKYGIPTAKYKVFTDLQAAVKHIEQIDYPFVIKASGLAAGKGVILPDTIDEAKSVLQEMMVDKRFGSAGDEIIIEERLEGEEVSLLAFCDGKTFKTMPPAQDHKRLLNKDEGPNTGGMGTYAPAPAATEEILQYAEEQVFKPAMQGFIDEGIPYQGVLYAGLILTPDGVKVLEFNARFGDPETQVILPLLDSDLVEILFACTKGELEKVNIQWKKQAAACIVLASAGYPQKTNTGFPISGLAAYHPQCEVFHAGTKQDGDVIVNSGGRVLGVTAWDNTLECALQRAYSAVDEIHFEGMQYRTDIGIKALTAKPSSTYASAGVDIDAGNKAVELMKSSVRSTYNDKVLAGIGAFGGLFDAAFLKKMKNPVLVASTDGVGTKVKLAAQCGHYESIGEDIVNHCIDDIFVQGARPLFFLDYFASSKLEPEQVAGVVKGVSKACRESGVVVLGGETAEMPGVYACGEFDVAGTIVGYIEKEHILPKDTLKSGDVLIGIRSNSPHTNGFSLIRKIFEGQDLSQKLEDGTTLEEALLKPHRSYLNLLVDLVEQENSPIKALAHLTGGGFFENIPRILPDHLAAVVNSGSWPVLPIFKRIQKEGNISKDEMHRVFNMGIGMIVITAKENTAAIQSAIPEETWVIGELTEKTDKRVILK